MVSVRAWLAVHVPAAQVPDWPAAIVPVIVCVCAAPIPTLLAVLSARV